MVYWYIVCFLTIRVRGLVFYGQSLPLEIFPDNMVLLSESIFLNLLCNPQYPYFDFGANLSHCIACNSRDQFADYSQKVPSCIQCPSNFKSVDEWSVICAESDVESQKRFNITVVIVPIFSLCLLIAIGLVIMKIRRRSALLQSHQSHHLIS